VENHNPTEDLNLEIILHKQGGGQQIISMPLAPGASEGTHPLVKEDDMYTGLTYKVTAPGNPAVGDTLIRKLYSDDIVVLKRLD
jgi:hypothetical protein